MTKRHFLLVGLFVFLLLGALYSFGVIDCVAKRAEIGIPSDWATVKDCSY